MASSSGKRVKMTAGQASKVQSRRLFMERTVTLKPGEVTDFLEEFRRRKWSNLGSYPESANIAIVKEFYTNARKFSESDIPFVSYVRGKRIPFDAATINSFLETDWEGGDTPCQFAQLQQEDFDYTAIERAICRPGGTFRRNRQGQPVHIKRSDLTPLCKIWMTLMLSNISPCSHVSDVTANRSLILFCITTIKTINLGDLISKEIYQCAHAAGSKAPLGHPSLVTHLCQLAGYCLPDDDGPVAPPPPLPARRRARPPAAPQVDLLPYLTSIHWGQLATSQMLRDLSFAMPELNIMSVAAFDEYVAWPRDQSHSTGGGEAAADEDEEEEDDDDFEESDDNIS
ncbi:hypothetical protein V8G54_011619 [Vigna mungo]|uniref:Putative plant transposon protein domain-containing protein n=1 Tax=Vigna mungo TaxID=3915 RepID=A0AAQ3NRK3_VIGMU